MSKGKPGPPKDQADFSSNWKKLLNTIAPAKEKRKGDCLEKEHTYSKKRKLDLKKKDVGDQKHEHKKAAIISNDTKSQTEKNDHAKPTKKVVNDPLVRDSDLKHPTKALSMDCEMVGVGPEGVESVLARVSMVNQHGHCVYDTFVRPREKVTDYRTHVSGVRASDLFGAKDFLKVQKEVSDLLKGRVLVGHALHNDLKVLFLEHPKKDIRDTSRYKPFKELSGSGRPSLKKLSAKILEVSVQEGEHNSIQDAQAAMGLYMMHRKKWETDLYKMGAKKKNPAQKKKKKVQNSKKVQFNPGS